MSNCSCWKPREETKNIIFIFLIAPILLATSILVFVPFYPGFPEAGLDPSWRMGMNQAVAQGLIIGKDIVFTFGPYASVFTKEFHPSLDALTLVASSYLALSYWAMLLMLFRSAPWFLIFAYYSIMVGLRLVYLPDNLLFSMPLLAGLALAKLMFPEPDNTSSKKRLSVQVAILFSPLGLLPLIKGSALIAGGVVLVVCLIFLCMKRHALLALICLVSPLCSMLIFWWAAGQPVGNLGGYLLNMLPVISGYSEAMALDGKLSELVLYVLSAGLVLLAIWQSSEMHPTRKVFVVALFIPFIFLSFKAGFVRHDSHAVIAGTSIVLAVVLMQVFVTSRLAFLAVLFSMATWFAIDRNYVKTTIPVLLSNMELTYIKQMNGLVKRFTNPDWLNDEYGFALAKLRDRVSFPDLPGVTDIYSYNQAFLLASKNTWAPRPVFQSYSSYLPALSDINKWHVLGENAPDNIIFSVEAIDGRFPSIEDGASWPALLHNYRPTIISNGFLLLEKTEMKMRAPSLSKLSDEKHLLNERVPIPSSDDYLFATINIEPTLFGRLANLLYKSSLLRMTVELKSNEVRSYRLPAGMARSGFLVSPLVESTADFGFLYGGRGLLSEKAVRAIRIASAGDWGWKNEYTISFSQVINLKPINISEIFDFDGVESVGGELAAESLGDCRGSIDVINDQFPAPRVASLSGLLKVSGWLAVSNEKGSLVGKKFVVLTEKSGKRILLKTRIVNRPDVATYFNDQGLFNSGYSTVSDISELVGEYSIGLGILTDSGLKLCEQPKFVGLFNVKLPSN